MDKGYIIDGRVRLRTELLMRPWQKETLNPVFERYIDLYKMQDRISKAPVRDTLSEAKQAGISDIVVCGGNRAENDQILQLAEIYFDIAPVPGINLNDGIKAALSELTRVADCGVGAINFAPFMSKLDVNDKRCFPVYALCEQRDLTVVVHGSMHYWPDTSMYHGSPDKFDDIAVNFPHLRIVVSHAGSGFSSAILPVAQRHDNVYLEFSALNPDYTDSDVIQAINSYLRNKCIFGSDYPLIPFHKAVGMWKAAVRPDVQPLFFYENAARVLSIEQRREG